MARLIISSLSSLILLAALTRETLAIEFKAINNADSAPGGSSRFDREIGIAFIEEKLKEATNFIQATFQYKSPSNPMKNVRNLMFVLDNTSGDAYTSNNVIHVSNRYIEEYPGDVRREVTGLIYHHLAHIWQWSGGHGDASEQQHRLLEGIADYVRLKSSFVPMKFARAGEGTRWDEGGSVTARFLEYCSGLRGDFVAALNGKLRESYDVHFFVELLGKPAEELWMDYMARHVN